MLQQGRDRIFMCVYSFLCTYPHISRMCWGQAADRAELQTMLARGRQQHEAEEGGARGDAELPRPQHPVSIKGLLSPLD